MKTVAFASAKDAASELARIDTERGYPSRGVQVGGGLHVDMDGPEGHGWTDTAAELLIAGDGSAALVVTDEIAAKIDGAIVQERATKWLQAQREQVAAGSPIAVVVADAERVR